MINAIRNALCAAAFCVLPSMGWALEAEGGVGSQLRHEIADLEALTRGELPRFTPLPALFEIDITDPAAVARRIEELQARLPATQPALSAAVQPATAIAAPNPAASAGEPPASPALEIAATSSVAQAATSAIEASTDGQRLRRNQLRLQFLQLPAGVRERLLTDDVLRRERAAFTEQQVHAEQMQEASERERNAALQAAEEATSAAERELAIEVARLQSHRAELATQAQAWNRRNQSELDLRAQLSARYQPKNSAMGYSPAEADSLYRDIRRDLQTLRDRADAKLSTLSAPSEVIGIASALSLNASVFAPYASLRTKLVALRASVAGDEAQLREREVEERYRDAQEVMLSLQTLQAQRIELHGHLSPERRAAVSGFTGEGFSRLRSELAHVTLMARWYPEQRRHEIAALPGLLRDVFTAGRVGLRALGLVALLLVYGSALRRHRALLNQLRVRAVAAVDSRTVALRINGLFLALGAVASELLLLALVYAVFDQLLGTVIASPELTVFRKLAYALAWYRLTLAVVHRLLLNAVRRYRRVEPELNEKMLVSVRLIARFALGIGVYLILSKALLGRGALYGIALNLAWIGAAFIAYQLIQMWREEVAQSYLRLFPNGRLAAAVRGSSKHLHGLFVALLAFAFVAVRGVWIWLRDIALGFEQTRKALAYLLRRRLERQAERQAGAAPEQTQLPAILVAALTEDDAKPALRLNRYPEQDAVFASIEALARGQRGVLVALVGERGAGKTTWLNVLSERSTPTLPVALFTLEQRLLEPIDLLTRLGRELGFSENLSEAELIVALLDAPPRAVFIDLAQNVMLRAVGGLACYECLLRIARATVRRVVWVLAFSRWPYEFMQRLHPGQDIYDMTVRMKGWSEHEISDLIELRMKAAGFTADYGDLQLDSNLPTRSSVLPLGPDGLPMDGAERTSDRYHRIVWDYADGNPRVALHFWRHSLLPDGDARVKVRLFATPSLALLEATGLRTRFLLAALLQHENLSAAEAARTLRQSEAECESELAGLHAKGVLSVQGGRYRVDSHWNRAVLRFLQRKKLLVI